VDPLFDGWLVHDYFEYQFSKRQVLAEREGNAKRQKKWRDQHKQDRNGVSNDARNGVTNSAPSRPDPKGRVSVGESSSVRNAHTREPDDDPIIQTIIGVLADETGRTVDPEWADKVRRQILAGRNPSNPAAYIAACLRADPRDYLPTGDAHPSSRSVREALAAARGDQP
jgi:hypothetical protein